MALLSADVEAATDTRANLLRLMRARYQFYGLVNRTPDAVRDHISRVLGTVDAASEGYLSDAPQRDLSIKFHWGHDHDFGDGFRLDGRMRSRHIDLLAEYIDAYGLPQDLTGRRVLDIGAWTGGVTLLLAALGAEVIACEEVVKYAEMVNYLADAFGLADRVRCLPRSLFDALPLFADYFDSVIYAGVIYHVTDPVLSLRLIFSALKDGGTVYLETYGSPAAGVQCEYEGPTVIHNGDRAALNRGGWNYFVPTAACLEMWCRDAGFQEVTIGPCDPFHRIKGAATRTAFQDFCRAGLSRANCR
jgi:SAM-dependent methyltransferase